MGYQGDIEVGDECKPAGYILNVSSREGILEFTPKAPTKNGKHVHTNMTKASLNMITATEAAEMWRTKRVAMNTVDPGYMSAAPEIQNVDCPLTWDDGAGRVLWPIAVGEREERSIWGRFLKHYGRVKVNIGDDFICGNDLWYHQPIVEPQ
jgi:NAD(P)-dependent dehydrogenase (short-subunit alcohol dehydrogenase family)